MTASQALLLGSSGKPPIVRVFTTPGSGETMSPEGYGTVTMEAIGSGGRGFGDPLVPAGGGGGQYARSNDFLAIAAPGLTPIQYNVGSIFSPDSWARLSTASPPSSSSDGCLAKDGTNASSGTPGIGNVAGSVGAVIHYGGNGVSGAGIAVGGGGAGASSDASGQTGGTDTTGLSPAEPMAGADGGAYGLDGTEPGGGGGGHPTSGTNPFPNRGRVRIVFYP